ncbi:MAG: MFS transporter [Chloroflexi bacterium]|nr:MFS transporter [Chloroflexota bacterium]
MTVATRAVRGTWKALENRNYRWLWLGRLATSGTFHMQNVVQGWLVYDLTGSAFALAWVGAGWSVAMLTFGLLGGAMADRVDKRRLVFGTRLATLGNTLFIGLLVASGLIQPWHLALSSFINGLISAFLMPAQQSLVSDLVEPDTLMNAVSLDAVGMGLMGIVGASVAGACIDHIGPEAVYYLMTTLHALSAAAILRIPRLPLAPRETRSAWADLVAGAHYLRGQPLLALLLALEGVRVLFLMPYQSLLPAFAQDSLGFDASGLGLLQSAIGFGGLLASLIAGHLGGLKNKGTLLARSSIVAGLCLILFVAVRWVPGVFASLALVGGLGNLYMVLSSTLLLSHCAPAYRGRIVSMSMVAWGLMPLGTLPSGAIADRVGVPWVVGLQGAVVMAIFAFVSWRKPELKDLQ